MSSSRLGHQRRHATRPIACFFAPSALASSADKSSTYMAEMHVGPRQERDPTSSHDVEVEDVRVPCKQTNTHTR